MGAIVSLYLLIDYIYSSIYIKRICARNTCEVINKVPIVYSSRPLLTSFTLATLRPVVFVSPRHRGDRFTLAHEVAHANSPTLRITSISTWACLAGMIGGMSLGSMLAREVGASLGVALPWAVGFGISAWLFYLVSQMFDQPRAYAVAAREVGIDMGHAHRLAELGRLVKSSRGLRLLMYTQGLFGLPDSVEGAVAYLRELSENWMARIPTAAFALPWAPAAAGSLATAGLLASGRWGVSAGEALLAFAAALLGLLAVAFLLSLVVRPLLRPSFGVNAGKVGLALSSAYLAAASLLLPLALAIPAAVFAVPAASFAAVLLTARMFAEGWRHALKAAAAAFLAVWLASAAVGAVVLWRLGLF